jgi:hypothetical protein
MKVIKKHIKKVVILYEDPDLKEGRRVIFGEPLEVFRLLMSQMPILLERMEKISKQKFESPMEMIFYYMKHKEDWVKLHGIEASNDMEMELTYEVKKLK